MNRFFTWKEEYEVGIKKIDDQHKRLFDIVNDLFVAFTENTINEKLNDIFEHLIDYAQYHFYTEEQMFLDSNFEDTKEHIRLHRSFIITIKGYMGEIRNGNMAVIYKLMGFLRMWIKDHLTEEDRKYINHLSSDDKLKEKNINTR